MPINCVRTWTLLCTLQRGESYHCTTGLVTENFSWEVVIYTWNATIKTRHAASRCLQCFKAISPQWLCCGPIDMILHESSMISYMMTNWYHIWYHRSVCSIRSAAAFGSPCCSGLGATLPRLFRPQPAIPEMLAPDPLCLGDENHPGAAPTVAPHPDVHLGDPTAVTPVPLLVGGGVSKTQIVLEAVWDSGVAVAADEAWNEGGAPKHVCHRADVEAGQARVAGPVIEHGHFSSLHDTVSRQLNGLKRAEIHQDTSLWVLLSPLAPFGHKVQLKKSWGRTYHTRQSPCSQYDIIVYQW